MSNPQLPNQSDSPSGIVAIASDGSGQNTASPGPNRPRSRNSKNRSESPNPSRPQRRTRKPPSHKPGSNDYGTRNSRAKSSKEKPLTSQQKFLQIASLVKAYKPVTINGSPTNTVIKQMKNLCQQHPDHFNHYKNHQRLSYLQKYFLQFMEGHPQSTIYISFVLKPSDPDFPFDLDILKINLSIPVDYPDSVPKIVILNDDIPRGFAANVEIGFSNIAKLALKNIPYSIGEEPLELVKGTSLKSQFLTLDKYLEDFLKQEKRDTVKFVKTIKKKSEDVVIPQAIKPSSPVRAPSPVRSLSPINKDVPREVLVRRNQLVEDMVNKLPVKLFKKSPTESKYKLMVPIRQKQGVPELWYNNNDIEIMVSVPIDYPESAMTINIVNNFSTNLIIKKYKQQDETYENEMVDVAKQYKQYERNLGANFTKYDFHTVDLVGKMNKLVNNLGSFLNVPKDFEAWAQMSAELSTK